MGTARFLTNAPSPKKIRQGETEELSVYAYAPNTILTGKLKCYRAGGTSAIYTTAEATLTNNRVIFSIAVPGGETFSNLTRLEAWIEQGGVAVTEVRAFTPDTTQRKSPIRFSWLNLLGGVDHYTLYGEIKQEIAADKTTYIKELPATFAISDRGVSTQAVEVTEEFEVSSDFENEQTLSWLSELITSPETWIYEQGRLVPVDILTKSIVTRDGSLIQIKIKYRKANSRIVQNG
jgi:hypothetical protein